METNDDRAIKTIELGVPPSLIDSDEGLSSCINHLELLVLNPSAVEEQTVNINQIILFLKDARYPNDRKRVLKVMIDVCLLVSPKNGYRKSVMRALKSYEKDYEENYKKDKELIIGIISDQLTRLMSQQNFREIENINKTIGALNACFENSTYGLTVLDGCMEKILPFLIKTIQILLPAIDESRSLTSKQEVLATLHAVSRIILSIFQKFEFAYDNKNIALIKNEIEAILDHSEITVETKNNFAIILFLCTDIIEGITGWKKIIKDYFEGSCDEVKRACILFGLLNAFDSSKLDYMEEDETRGELPMLILIGYRLIDVAYTVEISSKVDSLLATCRAILGLLKQMSKIFPDTRKTDDVENFVKYCFAFIVTHLEFQVDTVRHLAKDLMLQLVDFCNSCESHKYLPLMNVLLRRVLNISIDRTAFYVGVTAIGIKRGCDTLIEDHHTLVSDLLMKFSDPATFIFAYSTAESLMKKHFQEMVGRSEVDLWHAKWVFPLVKHIMYNSHKLSSFAKTKLCLLLAAMTRLHPDTIHAICALPGAIKYPEIVMCCLRSIRRTLSVNEDPLYNGPVWKSTLDVMIIKRAMCHQEDKVRLSALSVISESHKRTEFFNTQELFLIRHFLKYNMNSQDSCVRQEILASMKKVFSRIIESYKVFKRKRDLFEREYEEMKGSDLFKQQQDFHEREHKEIKENYYNFVIYLRKFLLNNNLFPGANCNRRVLTLELLILLQPVIDDIIGDEQNELWTEYEASALFDCLDDSYENNKILAADLLKNLNPSLFKFDDENIVSDSLDENLQLASNSKPSDSISAAYKLHVWLHFPKTVNVLKRKIANGDLNDRYLIAIQWLLIELENQLQTAQTSITTAAVAAPMYGVLFCIRHLLENCNTMNEHTEEWENLVKQLIKISFELNNCVSPIVNNSSPEGHLPVDYEMLHLNEKTGYLRKITPQVVLLCAWRTVKETSLLLGEIVSKFVPEVETEKMIIPFQKITEIGQHFIALLSETKHRGAFEQAYVGFLKLVTKLWRCKSENLAQLPQQWLNDLMTSITGQVQDNLRLCPTRRSAGLPFMIQAITVSEPKVGGKSKSLAECMGTLITLASMQDEPNVEPCTHSMNIMRALFRHSELGDVIVPFIERALNVALDGFSCHNWMVRNAATLLFSTLMTRIFGVQRHSDSDNLNIRNKMTGRVFFQKYTSLHEDLLLRIQRPFQSNSPTELSIMSLYPCLLLLSRLYPSVLDGLHYDKELLKFFPHIIKCLSSSIYKIRQVAAKAIAQLMNEHLVLKYTLRILNFFSSDPKFHSANYCHGLLLMVFYLIQAIDESHLKKHASGFISQTWSIAQVLRDSDYYQCPLIHDTLCKIFNVYVCRIEKNADWEWALDYIIDVLDYDTYDKCAPGEQLVQISLALLNLNALARVAQNANFGNMKYIVITYLANKNDKVVILALKYLLLLSGNKRLLTALNDSIIPDEIQNCEINTKEYRNVTRRKLLYDRHILNYVKSLLNSNVSREMKSVLYLVVAIYLKDASFRAIYQNMTENDVLKHYITLCRSEHASLTMPLLYCVGSVLIQITITRARLSQDVITDFCDLLYDYSSPEIDYGSRFAVATIIAYNYTSMFKNNNYVSDINLCTLWATIVSLLEDDERVIRDRIGLLFRFKKCSEPLHSELVRDRLFDIFISRMKPISKECCTMFLLKWILQDNSKEELVDQNSVFTKGEINIYSEEICTVRLACKHLKRILIEQKVHIDIWFNYFGKLVNKNEYANWLERHTDASTSLLSARVLSMSGSSNVIKYDNNVLKYKLNLSRSILVNN